jgi:uncharacterized peroxidase-related enzyme
LAQLLKLTSVGKLKTKKGISESMERINSIKPEEAIGKSKVLLDGIQEKLGMVPNMMRSMAQSPAVLEGYLNLSDSLAGGELSAKLQEQIALVVGESNGCKYCLSVHSAKGQIVGMSKEEILDSRRGESCDSKSLSALCFALKLVTNHGRVSDKDLALIRKSGFSEGAIAEIIANVALNLLTNYFNLVAEPRVDYPAVLSLVEQQG